MGSRMDKYNTNITENSETSSRTSRNKKLYDDLYSNTSYSNSVVLDDSKEIDINKIKELIDKQKRTQERKNSRPTIDLYKELSNIKDDTEEKIYDINEVLKEAKSKRDILEEASEKRKIFSNDYQSHLDLEEELAKTKKVYDKLLQEETELLDIMNTLTNVTVNSDKDAYKDLTTEANKFNTGTVNTVQIQPVNEETNTTPTIRVDKDAKKVKDVDDDSTEYSTNTFMFNKRDFQSKASYDDDYEMGEGSTFVKIIVVLITIAVLVGAYYIITHYILK
ncbi:MAG: hypothetical protein IKE73_03100 [Bacilli bacterium]|nr:hypothetical protein [Bacilli bacterium]